MIGINENSAELVLSPNSTAEEKKKEIVIEAMDKSLEDLHIEIVTAYLNDYNTIEVIGPSIEEHMISLKSILRNLTGMEIMEQTGTRLVAMDMLKIDDISVNTIVKRMDMITRTMLDDVTVCLEKKRSHAIEHRDHDVNRLYYLGSRVVKHAMENPSAAKKLEMSPWELKCAKDIMMRIEEIADRQKRICRLVEDANFSDDTLHEFRKIKKELKIRYETVMKSYYTKDKGIAFGIEATNRQFIAMCDRFFENVSRSLTIKVEKGKRVPDAKESDYCKDCIYYQQMGSQSPDSLSMKNIVPAAKMMENTKATVSFIKSIARTVMSLD